MPTTEDVIQILNHAIYMARQGKYDRCIIILAKEGEMDEGGVFSSFSAASKQEAVGIMEDVKHSLLHATQVEPH